MNQPTLRIVSDASQEAIALIEDLAAKQGEYEAAKRTVKEYDDNMKRLRQEFSEDVGPEVASLIEAGQYGLEITVAVAQRRVKNMGKLVKMLGPDVFLKLAKVNISDVEKYIPEDQLDEVLEKTPTNTRTARIIKRA